MKLCRVPEIAEIIGVSESQVYKLMKEGMPVIRFGRNTRFDSEEVIDWLKKERGNDSSHEKQSEQGSN